MSQPIVRQPSRQPAPWSQSRGTGDQFPTAPIPAGQPTPGSYPDPEGHPAYEEQPPMAGQPPFQGAVPSYDRDQQGAGRRTAALAAVIALVVGLGAGFAVGRQTAPEGATSLAQAFQLASAGKLPAGDLSSVRGNLGRAFRRGTGQGGQGQGGNQQAAPGSGQGGATWSRSS